MPIVIAEEGGVALRGSERRGALVSSVMYVRNTTASSAVCIGAHEGDAAGDKKDTRDVMKDHQDT